MEESSNTACVLEHVIAMEKRIIWLENQIEQFKNNPSTTTNLMSPSFLSRAFAVWGHFMVAQLLIFIPLYCLLVIFGLR